MNKQSGFTLVEIAIVLVIIGLLLGGVLKGQELINQAKIKNIANDLNGMTAAVYAYQDRYKRFPGDDDQAEARWTDPATKKGNGDAKIGTAGGVETLAACGTGGADVDGELCRFWQHLRLSGLIAGDTASAVPPQNAANGVLQVQDGGLGLSGTIICTTNLLGKIANAIDAQFDDGLPDKGQVRATSDVTKLKTGVATDTAYVDDGAKVYAVCKSL